MSFQQGLSGLNATSKSLEVIGNNIANSGTYGAKASRAEFGDVYAAALGGSSSNSIGIGVRIQTVAQQFTQGGITTTDNPLDVAINGRGFFQVSDGASPTQYSRNGQFKVNREGFVVNNAGYKLMGYGADPGTGQITPGLAVPLQLPTGGIAPHATAKIDMQLNLNASKPITRPSTTPSVVFDDAETYNNATSVTVYDAKGQPVALTYYFQRVSKYDAAAGSNDEWAIYATANGHTVAGTADDPQPVTTVTFAPDGSKPTATTAGTINTATNKISIDPFNINGIGPVPDHDTDPTNDILPLDITGVKLSLDLTQFASAFGVTNMGQDGFSAGQLISVNIENNGIVTARYSNGQTKSAGQVEIANFRNLQGLQPRGDNMWAYTYASGDPIVGVPGEGGLGVLQAGALEESNVDMTAELVNMITAQRAYQANAQTIKTQDQVLQTLVNLR